MNGGDIDIVYLMLGDDVQGKRWCQKAKELFNVLVDEEIEVGGALVWYGPVLS